MDLTLLEVVLAIAAVALGTAVQSSIGFGMAMIAAPLLVLLDRSLVPGPLIAAAMLLGLWMAWRERHAIHMANLKPAIAGRILGTPPAAALMGVISTATFDLLFGLLVMIAVLISLIHPHIRPSRQAVFWATAASGFMSTISSIGGPPLALVYQHSRGAELRANLAMLFIIGTVISLLALAIVGQFGLRHVGQVGVLATGIVLGVAVSGPLKRMLDQRTARPWLLGLCFASGAMVLGRALLG